MLVGPGNNGGDGLVAARHLHDWGARVHLYLCSPRPEDDPNLVRDRERGIPIAQAGEDGDFALLERLLSRAEVVLDALLGTGRLRPLEGVIKEVLVRVGGEKARRPRFLLVALDLPSGMDATTGQCDPSCLSADVTITLGYPKVGLFSFPGAERVGRLVTKDIGIPQELAQGIATELMTPRWARCALPPRPLSANKGTFGRAMVVAGSINYIGAAYLACAAAGRVGAGLVTLATPRSLLPILAAKLSEATYLPLPEADPGILGPEAAAVLKRGLGGYNTLLFGCGLGQDPATAAFVRTLLFSLPPDLPALVLDADGLNNLAQTPQWWQKVTIPTVLTPHPGEMARLTGLSIERVQAERLGVARDFAARWGKVVVLKGAYTVVASPGGEVMVYGSANPGLASGGTGDVLAGAIAGLLAQGLSLFVAASLGVFLHAEAGERVRKELGEAGLMASDLLSLLPRVMKGLREL